MLYEITKVWTDGAFFDSATKEIHYKVGIKSETCFVFSAPDESSAVIAFHDWLKKSRDKRYENTYILTTTNDDFIDRVFI